MALKDKLMTLEDFKAVRDVDVASNQTQFSAINDLLGNVKADLGNVFGFDSSTWSLGSLSTSTGGEISSTSRVLSQFVPALKNDVVKYNGNDTCLAVHEYRANKGWISGTQWLTGNTYKVVSDDAKYIRIVIRKSVNNPTISEDEIAEMVGNVTMSKVIPKSAYDADNLASEIESLQEILTVPIVWTDGYNVKSTDGTYVASSGYKYATIPVSLFRGGTISGKTACAPNNYVGFAFYDVNDAYISGQQNTTTGSYKFEYSTIVPDDAVVMRISLRIADEAMWENPAYPWDAMVGNIMQNDSNRGSNKNVVESARHVKGNVVTPLTLLHLSDIHGDSNTLKRIMAEANTIYTSLIDDKICTGDMAPNTAVQIASWWDETIMTCIGNHDSASYSGGAYNWTALSMADRDAYYITPFKSNWNITHTAGKSYYYKDYTTQKVRLIVMDAMLYVGTPGTEATEQTTWLEELLNDAITNDLHVLIAIHAPHGGASAIDCSFSRYNQSEMPTNLDCNTPQTVIDVVASAITNGLKFVGYICGHTHQDNIWDASGDGKQLMYCITCTGISPIALWNNSDLQRKGNLDAYNIITIDTSNTLIKIVRCGGADIDDHMRSRKAICFDYSTGTKVGEVL